MAIWQYKLHIIPKKAVLEQYGKIPSVIFVDHQSWEAYWKNVQYDGNRFPNPDFEDAHTKNWWSNTKVVVDELVKKVDMCVQRAHWDKGGEFGSYYWKGTTNLLEDHDAFISYDKETNSISEFQFRADLRNEEKALRFLNAMLQLCQELECLVFNVDGDLFEPDIAFILKDIKKSRAVHFLKDPEDFFDTLEATKNNEASFWNKIQALFK
ncbi:hypothetical protein KORDIASMS9_03501 [Kordia sp. SMS9]|uniref:hypothetical protein n=1 Tax=Kordia sp. SMS9 TaxID=2282170 RepID=UPI000E0DA32D|nr:hypothetical protein [Kordia sp. SMS9]AXG71244.1 hypothetical protein KORDIASMS9_03501 [Kordia sp. SMS9]